ncbi:MAG: ABC transporter substrate-binding protein [Candidatus Bathyarchaeia archaeon]
MKKERFCTTLTVTILALSMLSLFPIPVKAQLPHGIPREETLILDVIHGRTADPTQMNAWVPGTQIGWGLHQFILDTLWYTDHGDGSLICALASEPPIYNEDYTVLTLKLRRGIYWSDGVEFTADDVVYTVKTIGSYEGFTNYPLTKRWVKNIYASDKYTVVVELNSPNPYFWTNFLIEVWGCPYYIMPKHVFEKQDDPTKYKFSDPVSLGPYVLIDRDPTGYWFLLQLRDDWERTAVGVWCKEKGYEKPGPKYIWAVAHETEESKILAQARHELDWIFDVTTEGWKALKLMNPTTQSWFEDFPWIFPYDCTARGIFFNCDKYPYNITAVRWALTLAINATEVMITAFDGCQIFVPVPAGMAYPVFKKWQLGLKSELMNFELTLPDGTKFKPFDATIPYKIYTYYSGKYKVVNLPVEEIWGPGWWKFSPDVAAKLLEANGFKKGPDGKWRLPDGSAWTITINGPTYELDSTRMVMAVAECWRDFGIDVTVRVLEGTPFWNEYNYGFFEVGGYWGWGAQDPLLVGRVYEGLHSSYYKPEGEYAPAGVRYRSPELDALIDQVMAISPFKPEAEQLTKQILLHLIANMPAAFMFDCKKFSPYDTYYWTGFPSGKNPYWSFLYWCAGAKYILPRLKPAQVGPPPAISYVTVYAKTSIPAFTGADGKSYGPYVSGDAMVIPKDDADALVAAGKATYSPPVPPEIPAIAKSVSDLLGKTTALEASLNSLSSTASELKSSIDALSTEVKGLSSTLSTLMAASIAIIVLVIIGIVLLFVRGKS